MRRGVHIQEQGGERERDRMLLTHTHTHTHTHSSKFQCICVFTMYNLCGMQPFKEL